jgi:MFS family permease
MNHLMPNPNSWMTKLTLLLASSLTVMAGATVSPALPAMKQHFESAIVDPDLRTTLVKLIITLPALFIVIGSLIAGLVVDQWLSFNWAQVLTGLAISGMGLGILMPNMSVWLSAAIPDAMRG